MLLERGHGDHVERSLVGTYSVTVTDPGNHLTTNVTLQVTSTGVVDGGTTYPDGTAVPVTAP